jgi:hypothetical protein
MFLKKNTITDFLYIMLAIIIAILVVIGYMDMLQKDQAQKLALKQYKVSESLLKSKLTELQSALDLLNKGE